ncbi:hypothetical protein ACT3HK_10965 [Thermolongibacillus altinsuensis]
MEDEGKLTSGITLAHDVNGKNKSTYEMRLKFLRDQLSNLRSERRAGLEEGLKKGREEERKKIVRNMAAKGMKITDIADIVGLTEEVQKLLEE